MQWTFRDAELTNRFYETAGWFRDGAAKVEEIPADQPVDMVHYRIDLRSPNSGSRLVCTPRVAVRAAEALLHPVGEGL